MKAETISFRCCTASSASTASRSKRFACATPGSMSTQRGWKTRDDMTINVGLGPILRRQLIVGANEHKDRSLKESMING